MKLIYAIRIYHLLLEDLFHTGVSLLWPYFLSYLLHCKILTYHIRAYTTPAAYKKNEGFRVVAYWNVIEICPIFDQKSPKNWTFGQKSGGLFEFSLIFQVVAVWSRVASYRRGYGNCRYLSREKYSLAMLSKLYCCMKKNKWVVMAPGGSWHSFALSMTTFTFFSYPPSYAFTYRAS